MIKMMLLAGAGGFVGTCGRFLIGKWSSAMFHGAFPMGNISCKHYWLLRYRTPLRTIGESTCHDTRGENVMLITGFCGGFTTFSSFADDMWVLGSKGD